MRRHLKKDKHGPKNRVYNARTLDEILDEMAIKWALKAEKNGKKGLALKK